MSLKDSNNSKNVSPKKGANKKEKKIESQLSVKSVRSSDELVGYKSITEEDSSMSESDNEAARREAQKRESLTLNKADTYQTEASEAKRKSTDKMIEAIANELPKDIFSFLIWINIIAGVLSIIFLTVSWVNYIDNGEKRIKIFLVTISMMASIVGQVLSLIGAIRSIIWCLVLSVPILLIDAILSIIIIIYYLDHFFEKGGAGPAFSLIAFVTVILGLTVATIVLNILHIRRITTKISQTNTLHSNNSGKTVPKYL